MDPNSFAIMMDTLTQLGGYLFVLAILTLVVVLIVWVVKIRTGQRLNDSDAAALHAMTQRLALMDERMAMLERILDDEVPQWRGNLMNGGSDYARQAG